MQTCLIVEDSALLRRIFSKMLRHLGFATLMAANVKEAQELCATALPDLALVDWNLPDKDGIDLVRFVRELLGGERPKVMMCTIENSPSHIEKALAAGADEYLMKPFSIDMLESKLAALGFMMETETGASSDIQEALGGATQTRVRRHLSRLAITAMAMGDREVRKFEPGSIFFRQGDAPDFAYVLMSGTVQISIDRAGMSMVLGEMKPFEMFGELTLLENTSRAVTATAIEACEVIRITMDHLQSELDKLSPFMRNWVDSHSEHLIFLLSKLANTDF